MLKKFMAVLLFLSFCAPVWLLAQEQDLVEMAKKEKARRESLKGKEIKVITNQDLQKMTKTPAIIIAGEIAATTETQENQQPPSQPANYTPPVVHRITVGNPAQAQPGWLHGQPLADLGDGPSPRWLGLADAGARVAQPGPGDARPAGRSRGPGGAL